MSDLSQENRDLAGKASVQQTTCCIVGAGPAGAFLALLLARQGIPVVLLEGHQRFDREFRADSVHPAILEIMSEIGLADALLALPHTQMKQMKFVYDQAQSTFVISDFSRLRTQFPYIAMIPQASVLNFLTQEAGRYPNFHLEMGARAEQLIEEDGIIRGVTYRGQDNALHEIYAALVVGTDGRFSLIRQRAGLVPKKLGPPMEVLWFNVPRFEDDPEAGGALNIGPGKFAILFNKSDQWQVGVVPSGTYEQARKDGIDALRRSVSQLVPWLTERLETSLLDWKQVSYLTVEVSSLEKWYRPGLLLLGDAAHVMNPIGGFGNNAAVQDAVSAANILTLPLREGHVQEQDLAKVQHERAWKTRILQRMQVGIQSRIRTEGVDTDQPFQVPRPMIIMQKIPFMRNLQARLTAFGIRPEHVKYRGSV